MCDLRFKFSFFGFIVFMIPMLINIVYVIFPPINAVEEATNVNKIWESIEGITRVLYAIAICILVSNQKINFKSPWFILGLVFLILYYIVWMRYFIGGRDVKLLGKSFLFIPLPLAIFPVLYYLFAAIWLHNYVAVIFMVIFGIAHNIVSYISLYNK
ncbi:hypothetical protein [Roseburia sp. 499]|uniref:hypothetical protein n=1 Tax=Roseburia sp. 499 TaxID=1261634 RepID=UPI0009518A16|nr:hypothetical protein [Roseburia sp. 499]WVK68640.1 hypothetical protein BIV20_09580 [Roseburia sp. 499]